MLPAIGRIPLAQDRPQMDRLAYAHWHPGQGSSQTSYAANPLSSGVLGLVTIAEVRKICR
jgi:hypothetical protein